MELTEARAGLFGVLGAGAGNHPAIYGWRGDVNQERWKPVIHNRLSALFEFIHNVGKLGAGFGTDAQRLYGT